MTFSYTPHLTTDVSLVRFHIGDTNSEGFYIDDEAIQYFVTTYSVNAAVVKCIQYIITQLSQPNFRLDWLTVSNEEARAGYENMLKIKAQEMGINLGGAVASASISLPYRADSYQHSTATRVNDQDTDETGVYDGRP